MTPKKVGRPECKSEAAKETKGRLVRHTAGSTKLSATQSVAKPHLNGAAAPGEIRKKLRDAGYDPIPIKGKIPPLKKWETKTDSTDHEIERWNKSFPQAKSTGLLTRQIPTLDIDIKIPDAAIAVEELVRERFGSLGKTLVRVGNAPKRAIPFKTDKPFKKITANLIAPDGSTGQKLELLADGQQFVAYGIHEDTKRPYTWSGGEPGKVTRDELPSLSEKQARELVEDAAELLISEHGYKRAKEKPKEKANGTGGGSADWQFLADNIRAGHELHDSIRDLAAKLVKSGMSGGAAVNFLYALMDSSDAKHDERWLKRRNDIKRLVESATGLPSEKPASSGSDLIYFNDAISGDISKLWLIKNVVAKAETSSWVGPPKSGKSAFIVDLFIALAGGTDWRDHTTKAKCGCVYFALERGDLAVRRLRGHAKRDRLKDLPIAIKKGIIDLMDADCVEFIVDQIRETEKNFGITVGIIAIDTFLKGIAANGGDEDKAKDQNRVYANLRRIQEMTGVHIALVHHTGKDESKGARGSSAHGGDMDMMARFSIDNNIVSVNITDANDQPTGPLTSFALEPVDIGHDEDGEILTTFIVGLEEHGKRDITKKLSPQATVAIGLLNVALQDLGVTKTLEGELHRVVTIEQWKTNCERGALSAGDKDSFRRVFQRCFDTLRDKKRI